MHTIHTARIVQCFNRIKMRQARPFAKTIHSVMIGRGGIIWEGRTFSMHKPKVLLILQTIFYPSF